MSKLNKRIEWEERVKDWNASGLSVARWCIENGLKDHQMYYWIQRLNESPKAPDKQPSLVNFFPVKVTTKPDEPKGSVLIHINQLSVEVKPDTDLHLLSKVLHVLQS